MTNERLEELNNMKKTINDLEEALNTLVGGHYDYLEIVGRYKGDQNGDYIMDSDHIPDLRSIIINYVRDMRNKLKKEFEEA